MGKIRSRRSLTRINNVLVGGSSRVLSNVLADTACSASTGFIKTTLWRPLCGAPHRGRQRVVLINPVEALQAVSANTLLKTLEEPPTSTLFILVSDRLDRILPTIRSRCRLIALPRPHKEQALAWLSDQVQLNLVR